MLFREISANFGGQAWKPAPTRWVHCRWFQQISAGEESLRHGYAVPPPFDKGGIVNRSYFVFSWNLKVSVSALGVQTYALPAATSPLSSASESASSILL